MSFLKKSILAKPPIVKPKLLPITINPTIKTSVVKTILKNPDTFTGYVAPSFSGLLTTNLKTTGLLTNNLKNILGTSLLPYISTLFPPVAIPIKGRNNGTKLDDSGDKFDASELTINNGNFQPAGSTGGITILRPEILSLFNFYPIYNNTTGNRTLNSYGKFLEVNFQSSYLQRDSVVELVSNLEKSLSSESASEDIKNSIKKINKWGAQDNLENISKILKYESGILDTLNHIKNGFDIKKINESSFKYNNSLSLLEIYTQKMGYTKEQFNLFSNSKIYNQMILDLRSIIENYSFGLLGIIDKDRVQDYDPINLDKTYSLTDDNFTFKLSLLGNKDNSIDAVSLKIFDAFQNSLPANITNRLRIILTLLSKEFRVSKGLGTKDTVKFIKNVFGTSDMGSPFDNILGVPGNNVLEKSTGGKNNLSSLSLLDVDRSLQLNTNYNTEMFVLPFEKKYIDSTIKKSTTYIPGTSYFIDSILQTQNIDINLTPINSYTDSVVKITTDVKEAVNLLLDTKNRNTELLPDKFYQQFLSTIRAGLFTSTASDNLARVAAGGQSITIDESASVILMSLAKLASKNRKLNHLLFQYYILSGINLKKNSNVIGGELWDGLASEISDIRNIPFFKDNLDATFTSKNPSLIPSFDLKNTSSLSSVSWALELLATAIEKTVAKIILNKNELPEAPFVFVDNGVTPPTIEPKGYIKELNKVIPNADLRSLDITRGVISKQLNISANTNGIIKSFADFLTWISRNATADNSFLVNDGSFRTRFNFLSPSSIMLLSYELFNDFMNKYFMADFVSVEKGNGVIAFWDKKSNATIFSEIINVMDKQGIGTTDNTETLTTPAAKVEASEKFLIPTISNNLFIPKNGKSIETKTGSKEKVTIKSNSSSSPKPKNNKGNKRFASKPDFSDLIKKNLTKSFIQSTGEIISHIRKNTFLSLETDKLLIGLVEELHRNQEKILEEDYTIISMLNAIDIIVSKIKDANTLVNNTFSKQKIDESLLNLSFLKKKNIDNIVLEEEKLENFEYPYTMTNLKKISDIQQVQLSWNMYNTFENKFLHKYENVTGDSNDTFIASTVIHKDVKNTLYSYLASANLTEQNEASTRIKILSVGIPSGFRTNLVDRISINSTTNTKKDLLTEKQIDLIKINVYKRETRYSDIIFKPQTFIFDLSMFQLENGIIAAKPSITDNFENILQKIILQNYELNNGTISPFQVSLLENNLLNSYSINNLETYNIISDKQKKELITNHVVSFLLEKYINLLSGVKVSEETFTEDKNLDLFGPNGPSESFFERNYKELLKRYLKDILGENIPEGIELWNLTKREDVSDNAKDIIRTMTYGNDFFVPGSVRAKILSPKTFERIFNLPINIDNFEVDVTETNKTDSGAKTLIQARNQNLLEESGLDKKTIFFKKRDKNDIILEDLFITIENII